MLSALKAKYATIYDRKITTLFDSARVGRFSIEIDGLFFDYSKTNIDSETKDLLLKLTKKAGALRKTFCYVFRWKNQFY